MDMDTIVTELDELKKKKSKIAKEKSVNIITNIFNQNKDYDFVINWIMKFHYSICEAFFDECNLSDNEAEKMVSAFLDNESFKKNRNKSSFNRGFLVCKSFLQKNINKSAISKLAIFIIRLGDKNKYFSDELISSFKKYIIDKELYSDFESLADTLEKEDEKRLIQHFLKTINCDNKVDGSIDVVDDITHKQTNSRQFEMQFEIIENIAKGIDKLLNMSEAVPALKIAIENDKAVFAAKDKEIEQLKSELNQFKYENSLLNEEKIKLQEQINKNMIEIESLDRDLKTLSQMNKDIKKQELDTLIKKVSDSLKFEYENYRLSSPTDFSEENFKANYAGLQHIFNILKRFGFNFE